MSQRPPSSVPTCLQALCCKFVMFKRRHVKCIAVLSESVDTEYLASVALDSRQGLLYYADNENGFIEEMTTDGNHSRTLFYGITKRPHAIVVDSNNR